MASAQAQQQTPPSNSPAAANAETVVITGNPLGSADVAAPSTVLSGERLVLKRGSTLGDTLQGLPGVSSTYFGPTASRPIIRGQDGDRIRVLGNGGASLDASGLSFDHAVPIDPLAVERIEVLRGPAALLYGGSAAGGVVNTIDNRIPRDAVQGLGGAAELRLGGAANERGASALVETGGALVNTGGSGFALHADGFSRNTHDLRVPAFDRPLDDGTTERRKRIANSASTASGGAFGGSMLWDHGHFGLSADTYRNRYGTVAEEDVTIRMRSNKVRLAGEVRDLGGFIDTVRVQTGFTDYRHDEIEGTGAIGTTFKNRGGDARLEAVHAKRPLGTGELQGVFGLQAESSRFGALGEEAFVPSTHSRQLGMFALEQWSLAKQWLLSGGVRVEHARIESSGDADPSDVKFGPPQQRTFTPHSVSVGATYDASEAWRFSSSVAYTERAPTSYELYANGVHTATAAFERGDPSQAKERGVHIEASAQWKTGPNRIKASVFSTRFSNYIAQVGSGEPDFVDDTGAAFPVFVFQGVRARLQGAEIEATQRLWQHTGTLDLEGHADVVRGDNLSTGEPLPRIAPLRATLALQWALGAWSARGEVQRAWRQTRVPADDTATTSSTLVNLSASYQFALGDTTALAFVKIHNAGNTLAYSATTLATVRALVPLPGRSLAAGLRVLF